jgi:hypothetical protein
METGACAGTRAHLRSRVWCHPRPRRHVSHAPPPVYGLSGAPRWTRTSASTPPDPRSPTPRLGANPWTGRGPARPRAVARICRARRAHARMASWPSRALDHPYVEAHACTRAKQNHIAVVAVLQCHRASKPPAARHQSRRRRCGTRSRPNLSSQPLLSLP